MCGAITTGLPACGHATEVGSDWEVRHSPKTERGEDNLVAKVDHRCKMVAVASLGFKKNRRELDALPGHAGGRAQHWGEP